MGACASAKDENAIEAGWFNMHAVHDSGIVLHRSFAQRFCDYVTLKNDLFSSLGTQMAE